MPTSRPHVPEPQDFLFFVVSVDMNVYINQRMICDNLINIY